MVSIRVLVGSIFSRLPKLRETRKRNDRFISKFLLKQIYRFVGSLCIEKHVFFLVCIQSDNKIVIFTDKSLWFTFENYCIKEIIKPRWILQLWAVCTCVNSSLSSNVYLCELRRVRRYHVITVLNKLTFNPNFINRLARINHSYSASQSVQTMVSVSFKFFYCSQFLRCVSTKFCSFAAFCIVPRTLFTFPLRHCTYFIDPCIL